MKAVGLIIGTLFIMFSAIMLRLFWHHSSESKLSTAAVERLESWRTEFGLPAYIFTIIAPITIYGIIMILASFESAVKIAMFLQPFLLLICGLIIGYFYFSKKRQIETPTSITKKVFSDMRGVGLLLVIMAIWGNWLYAVIGAFVINLIAQKLENKGKPSA